MEKQDFPSPNLHTIQNKILVDSGGNFLTQVRHKEKGPFPQVEYFRGERFHLYCVSRRPTRDVAVYMAQ